MTHDVVIVGGGIIGLSIADSLSQRGLDVVVIDRSHDGAASARAAGMLAPISEAKEIEPELVTISLDSLARWPDFAADLQTRSTIDLDFRHNGSLNVAIDADHHRALEHMKAQHDALGLVAEFLDTDATLELEPSLTPRVFSSLFCKDERSVNPIRVLEALRKLCGPSLRRADVTSVHSTGVDVSADGETESINAKRIVVAAGAWSQTIDGLDAPPNLRPVRGQMLRVQSDDVLASRPIRTPDVYLVPRQNGELVIGSTMEEVGYDTRQTFGGIMEISRDAWETIPGLYDAAWIETWSGFRPIAFDNLPCVKRSVTQPNLFYATGHGRSGILLAPWSAHAMTELILETF